MQEAREFKGFSWSQTCLLATTGSVTMLSPLPRNDRTDPPFSCSLALRLESQVQHLQGGLLDETDSSHLSWWSSPLTASFSQSLCCSWLWVPVFRSLLSIYPTTQKYHESRAYERNRTLYTTPHPSASIKVPVKQNQGQQARLARTATAAGYGEVLLESLTTRQLHGLRLPVPSQR